MAASRWKTFSLRTAIGVFLLLCVAFGFGARWYHQVRERGEAQRRLVERSKKPEGVRITITPNTDKPSWMQEFARKWVDPDYERPFANFNLQNEPFGEIELARDLEKSFGARTIFIGGRSISHDFAAPLFRTPGLKHLIVSSDLILPGGREAFFNKLDRAEELEQLHLGNIHIGPPFAEEIAKLPQLRELTIGTCPLEAFVTLSKAPKLETLSIGGFRDSPNDPFYPSKSDRDEKYEQRAREAFKMAFGALAANPHLTNLGFRNFAGFEAEDLRDFCRRSGVTNIRLLGPQMAPECLAEIAKLPNLQTLTIIDPTIRDEHLEALAQAKKLKQLKVGPSISQGAVNELREKLPGCLIQMR